LKLPVDGRLVLRLRNAVTAGCEQHTLQPVTPTVVNARALRAVSQARVCGKNVFCIVLSKKFNIMSALSGHQSSTLPQKIDSREGWFRCKKELACACSKMYFY